MYDPASPLFHTGATRRSATAFPNGKGRPVVLERPRAYPCRLAIGLAMGVDRPKIRQRDEQGSEPTSLSPPPRRRSPTHVPFSSGSSYPPSAY
jgi:hypothetical protein